MVWPVGNPHRVDITPREEAGEAAGAATFAVRRAKRNPRISSVELLILLIDGLHFTGRRQFLNSRDGKRIYQWKAGFILQAPRTHFRITGMGLVYGARNHQLSGRSRPLTIHDNFIAECKAASGCGARARDRRQITDGNLMLRRGADT